MQLLFRLAILLIPGSLAACASASKSRVVENEDGTLTALSSAGNEPDARIAAIDAAQDYCQDEHKTAVVQDRSLHGAKGPRVDWKKIPFLGEVLKDEGKDQVVVYFRCGEKSKSPT